MKGDYIYCLNPECNMLYKDIHELPDTRNTKVKSLCPYCHGTNTINTNVAISETPRHMLLFKTKDLTKNAVKSFAEFLKSEKIIKNYKIKKTNNTIYLYDWTDLKKEILKQGQKQNIYIEPITK